MDLVTDKDGNIKSWKISYCGFIAPKVLLNNEKPFQTAYISAETAAEAVKKLKREFHMCKLIITGKPVLELVSKEQFENN